MILFIFLSGFIANAQPVSNYKICFGAGEFENKTVLVIRTYDQFKQQFYVGIDPEALQTYIIPANHFTLNALSWQQILLNYKNTAYVKAIEAAKSQSSAMQNSGISHGYPKEKGIALTIDLCPSHKPLDRIIFTSLLAEFKQIEKPVPMALSITGRFMLTHSEDLIWLKNLETCGEISITWINHTYNHHFNPKVPLKDNFLLEPGTDLNFEILGTEVAMLEKGMLFSPFFRFPGLVSDQQLVEKVTNFGLIPIGSDAWLAKGQTVHNGNIVLIHGNGNEPLGIKDFIKLLHNEKATVMSKQWLLYDLRENVADEFEK